MKRTLFVALALLCGGVLAANAQATRNPMGTETGKTMTDANKGSPAVQGQATTGQKAMTTKKKKKKKKTASRS
jgi:hypothetical protein